MEIALTAMAGWLLISGVFGLCLGHAIGYAKGRDPEYQLRLLNRLRQADGHSSDCYPDPSHPGYWMCYPGCLQWSGSRKQES
jgi:hypothetical protein